MLFVRQRRPRFVSLELPGGKIRTGETPVQAAERELLEEAGLIATGGSLMFSLDLDLSTNLQQTYLVNFPQFEEGSAGEFPIEWVDLAEALQMARRSEITHVQSVIAILAKINEAAP